MNRSRGVRRFDNEKSIAATRLSRSLAYREYVVAQHIDIERLQYLTVRVDGKDASGGACSGTAFFVCIEDQRFPNPQFALVTNKHVVAGISEATLCFHQTAENLVPTGKTVQTTVTDFEAKWLMHPDANIDLCIASLGNFKGALAGLGIQVLMAHVISDYLPSDAELMSMSAVEDVLMVGYPIGIADDVSNLPIVRRGITAIHPSVDFNGQPISVIDMACFPGSSGSPVFAVEQLHGGNRKVTFLGVLFAGPTFDMQGKIVSVPIPTSCCVSSVTPGMVHLGYIVKARELRTLMELLTRKLIASLPELLL